MPGESFPPGFQFCFADKRALDNMYRAANTQGQLDWWSEHRYNELDLMCAGMCAPPSIVLVGPLRLCFS